MEAAADEFTNFSHGLFVCHEDRKERFRSSSYFDCFSEASSAFSS